MEKVGAKQLKDTVINGGYCSGCGVCTATKNSPFTMKLTSNGNYEPISLRNEENNGVHVVCPFADHNINEDSIARERFRDNKGINFDQKLGYYENTYAGHVSVGEYRKNGSSGGSVSWLFEKLIERKEVDYVIHVKRAESNSPFYEFCISKSKEDIRNGSKSRYYPVTMESVLKFVRNNEGKYAIVGVPCFIKGLQLLSKEESYYRDCFKYFISIVCGHLKTTHYLEFLISQFKVKLNEVASFNFRHKVKGRRASDYGTEVILNSGESQVRLNSSLLGTNWGLNLFKLKACDYCDDVIGETADISIGDAWLPQYANDDKGTNVVVVRNSKISEIIDGGIKSGELNYDKISPHLVYKSQAGGYRHRRQGLMHRLYLKQKKGEWFPKKRYAPRQEANRKRAQIYENRLALRRLSFESKNYQNSNLFYNELRENIITNEKLNKDNFIIRFLRKIKRTIYR